MAHHVLSSRSVMERNWGWTTSGPPPPRLWQGLPGQCACASGWLNVMSKRTPLLALLHAQWGAPPRPRPLRMDRRRQKTILMPIKQHFVFRSKYSSGRSGVFSSGRGRGLRYEVTVVTPLHGYRHNNALPRVYFVLLSVFFFSPSWKNPACSSRVCISSWPRQSYARRWNSGKFTGN